MLKALIRWLWPPEPQRTLPGPSVTKEWVEERLAQFEKETTWTLDEWYTKFSTLHARAEKATQRARKKGEHPLELAAPNGDRPSVLAHRRPWSV